jgi:hypothetical protein
MRMSNDECFMTKEATIPKSNAWSFAGIQIHIVSSSRGVLSFVLFEG